MNHEYVLCCTVLAMKQIKVLQDKKNWIQRRKQQHKKSVILRTSFELQLMTTIKAATLTQLEEKNVYFPLFYEN